MRLSVLKVCTLSLVFQLAVFNAYADAGTIDLPDIGDSSGVAITPSEERKLGEQLIRSFRRSLPFVNDPEINDYISNLGYRLVSQIDSPRQKYTFLVINASSINAFALPGGYVVVHSGLIQKTQAESELAAVVAHEIAHISQRHIARAMERSNASGLPTLAGVLAAMILASQNPELGQATLTAAIAASVQNQINFTRTNEKESDRVGIDLLAKAKFNPQSMPKFFERLADATRLYGEAPPEFLSTHPVSTSRIADSKGRAAQIANKTRGKRDFASSLTYLLMRAKLGVLTDEPTRSVGLFQAKLKEELTVAQKDAVKYGLAMAYLEDNKPDLAKPLIEKLLRKDKNRLFYQTALAKIEMERGKQKNALKIYDRALNLNPNNHAITLFFSEALLSVGQSKTATPLLRSHIRRYNNESPYLYELLARAEGESGYLSAAHRAQAEYYFLSGQTFAAIEQLKIAKKVQKLSNDQRLRIEARLKQLEQIAKEEEHI